MRNQRDQSNQGDRKMLAAGMAESGLEASPAVVEKLLAYRDLLLKWNRAYNLTAVKDPAEAIVQHLLDSLSILPWLRETERLLDVGSGGGLPGIPLAIARPELAVTLAEVVAKKAAFQRQVIIELGLANVHSWQGRIENLRVEDLSAQKFDGIVSRAFADMTLFTALTRHLLADNGRWLAMKGRLPEAEIAALPESVALEEIIPLKVPMLAAARHLLLLRPRK